MKTNEFYLVSYLQLEQVGEILNNKSKQIERFAYILHDKDVYQEDICEHATGEVKHKKGDFKEPHIHIYLKLYQSRELGEVKRWFVREENGQRINCLVQFVYDRCGAIAYLTHRTKKSATKYQYPLENVIAFNMDTLENESGGVDKTILIIEDILNNTPTIEMIKKYGREYVYHRQDFLHCVEAILLEKDFDKTITN